LAFPLFQPSIPSKMTAMIKWDFSFFIFYLNNNDRVCLHIYSKGHHEDFKTNPQNRKTKDGVKIKLFIIDVVATEPNSFLELSQRALFRKYIITITFFFRFVNSIIKVHSLKKIVNIGTNSYDHNLYSFELFFISLSFILRTFHRQEDLLECSRDSEDSLP
jgi:hypothetical protein